ncbi:MAG TPA: response regulator, partial [Spongiibacteraceae bacterium]|nr:response regulator [Spongiibacteraceae bacterium]
MAITPTQLETESLPSMENEDTTAVVLIVDDEPLNRFLIAEALAGDNYHIVEANSGEAAIEYMRNNNADLILLDIDMPGMGGIKACEAIRALPHAKLVPITMVTGLDDNASIEHAFECGATDFLTKPVNWVLMRQRVRFILRHGDITRDLYHQEQILEQVNEIAQIGHWQWDVVNRTIYLSEQYRRILPGLPARITNASIDRMPLNKAEQRIRDEIAHAFANHQASFNFECSVNVPTRGGRRLLFHGTIEYRDDKPFHLIGTLQDVTQRHQDEERYAAIFEASPVGIIETDCSRLFHITQQAGFAKLSDEQLLNTIKPMLTGNEREMFIVHTNSIALSILTPDIGAAWLKKLRTEMTLRFLIGVRDAQRELVMKCDMPQANGEHRHVVINLRLPRTPEEYRRVVITISDITELSRHEAQLKRADVIIANSRDAVAVMDKNSRVLTINPAYTRITGYTLEEKQAAGTVVKIVGYSLEGTPFIIRDKL